MIAFPSTGLVLYVCRVDSSAGVTIVGGPYTSVTGEAEAHTAAAELHRRHPDVDFVVLAMAEIEARA